MSPGIQTISQLNLPLKVLDFDIRCPVCGKWVEIQSIKGDGSFVVVCESEPAAETVRWRQWYEKHGSGGEEWKAVYEAVGKWFNSFYRFVELAPETVKKKRRMKWRRG